MGLNFISEKSIVFRYLPIRFEGACLNAGSGKIKAQNIQKAFLFLDLVRNKAFKDFKGGTSGRREPCRYLLKRNCIFK